jgi:catechol 2,3-dioxygenase-like lactoylglutathione lyase family enzyme
MRVLSVVETAIYVDDLDATEEFYRRVLGLTVIAKKEGRHVFFQVGDSNVLLAFNAKTTGTEDHTPHGASGPGHFALGIETQSLNDWREHLVASGVEIESEVEWPPGGKSIYFRDPAGNSVELVTPGVWRLPSGW